MVSSPDQNVEVLVKTGKAIEYSIVYNNDTVVRFSAIDITLDSIGVLRDFSISGQQTTQVDETWERPWGKSKIVENKYHQNIIQLLSQNNVQVNMYVRAYNNGVGIRYEFPEQDGLQTLLLMQEQTMVKFAGEPTVWMADYKNFVSSQEQAFNEIKLSDVDDIPLIGMPLLTRVNNSSWCVLTEANLTDWAGAFLKKSNNFTHGVQTVLTPHLTDAVKYLVKRKLPAVSPWRVFMLATTPAGLIESDLIANLNDPVAINDVSWIKPGVSAWDWWWSNSYAPSVDFEIGANQETMKYFIDFAAEMGWEYQVVDWLWYGHPFDKIYAEDRKPVPGVDITTYADGINIEDLVQYAAQKNVKIIIWLHWLHVQEQMEKAFPIYEKWGVAGLKIDFMDRQDQEMVNFYHDVVKLAAKHKLLVNFHGAYKPTGVSRTYPNLITREGVMGNEYTKWSTNITSEHNVTLPFTRGLLGEMDYTPVSFRNVPPSRFVLEGNTPEKSPVTQTTRAHQLALTVVFESALGVFCDSPDSYRGEKGLEFLKQVPTTWDKTKVINASVGNYITIARKYGDTWFVGSLTDSTARKLDIPLTFLDNDVTYTATLWSDTPETVKNYNTIEKSVQQVSSAKSIEVNLSRDGGNVIILKKN